MDDDRRETSRRNPEERGGQAVESDDDYDRGEDAGSGSAHARFGLQSRTREGTGSGVCTENSADSVCDTDGDEFLIRVDLVAVHTTEGYIDGPSTERQ